MSESVIIDGRLLSLDEARVPVLDRGLHYGEGVFDTMRAYKGAVFRARQHFDRLRSGADLLGLELAQSGDELARLVQSLLEANRLGDAYVRVTVTSGDGGFGMEPARKGPPRVIVVALPLHATPPEYYVKGVRAVISSVRRNETSPLSRIKSLNFLDNLLARRGARAAGVEEALFLNVRGNVAEAASSNVFLVLGGRLLTPDVDSGLLPGITRAVVLEVGGRLGLPVEEREVSLAELMSADEAFLTNSVVELLPLVSVEGSPIGKGQPGPVTLQLHAAYSSLVEEETSAQYTA